MPENTSLPEEAIPTEDNTIYDTASVEILPEYPGGTQKFYDYFRNNYHYPPAAIEAGVSGKLMVQFVVEKDGSFSDIRILRDLGYGTGNEAIKVFKRANKWKPGLLKGVPVRVAYILPIVINTIE